MKREQLLERLDTAWVALGESYAGLSEAQMTTPGVAGEWSVRDILAHVATWEEEALKYLPLIIEGGRPPRYASYGGLDAFNARMTEAKRGLSLDDVSGASGEDAPPTRGLPAHRARRAVHDRDALSPSSAARHL